jgi:hypothetical protein
MNPALSDTGQGTFELQPIGCNAAANTPVPGSNTLFAGRQLFKKDGSPVTVDEGCDKDEAVKEAIRSSRWGLVLEKLDWEKRQFTLIKPLLVPPLAISRGPLAGAVIASAYDPSMAIYHGQYWIAFEGIALNAARYGVVGTSSFLARFDMAAQEIVPETIHVVVSGASPSAAEFDSSSVPTLLVANDRLYIYWSAIKVAMPGGAFVQCAARGAELAPDSQGAFWVKGAGGADSTMDPVRTVEVWGPVAGDPMSDTLVDIKSLWTHGGKIVAVAELAGGGNAKPNSPSPGCYRMAMAEASEPLGHRIFNSSPLLDENILPTNPVDYVRPVKNPEGGYSFVAWVQYPFKNGYSELRIVPSPKHWPEDVIPMMPKAVVFPFVDRGLWPTTE